MSQLTDTLRKDMFQAKKDKDELTAGIVQLVMSAIKNEELKKDEALSEEEEVAIVKKESKKLQDSIEQFTAGGRDDLVETSQKQLEYVEQFLPEQLGEDQIEEAVRKVVADTGAEGMRDMGRVMGMTMKALENQADGSAVKDIVTKVLSE